MGKHQPAPDSSWIAEEELARLLNVTRDSLRWARPQLDRTEWQTHSNVVYWKKTAAARHAASLGLTLPPEHPPEKNPAPTPAAVAAAPSDTATPAPTPTPTPEPPARPGEELTVCSVPTGNGKHFPNPHLIRCRRANGDTVDVRVVDSAKYAPVGANGQPMRLWAIKADGNNFWNLVGREPRFRGAW